MNRLDHLLVITGEEAAEVTKEAAKCLRFGVNEIYPAIGITNIARLVIEFNQLYAMMEMLAADGVLEAPFMSRACIDDKKKAVEKHLLYSAECGRVTL